MWNKIKSIYKSITTSPITLVVLGILGCFIIVFLLLKMNGNRKSLLQEKKETAALFEVKEKEYQKTLLYLQLEYNKKSDTISILLGRLQQKEVAIKKDYDKKSSQNKHVYEKAINTIDNSNVDENVSILSNNLSK
jgi:beta-lactamase regulating signal transducer with metallopeptidase domain